MAAQSLPFILSTFIDLSTLNTLIRLFFFSPPCFLAEIQLHFTCLRCFNFMNSIFPPELWIYSGVRREVTRNKAALKPPLKLD